MPTITQVGGTRGIDETGLVDLLKTGMLTSQKNREDAESRKQGNDDLIRAGISSKTMRPAKDGEASDFKDSSGRGWVYDDSDLKEAHRQQEEGRKTQAWDTINSRAQAAAAESERTNPGSYWQTYNRSLATMVGHPDGKMSDDEIKAIGDRYGDSAVSYFNNFQTAGKNDRTGAKPADANLPHPGLLSIIANAVNPKQLSPSAPGGAPQAWASAPVMAGAIAPKGPIGAPGFNTGPSMPGQQGGMAIGPPGRGFDPMAMIQHIIAQTQVPNQVPNWAQQQNAQQ